MGTNDTSTSANEVGGASWGRGDKDEYDENADEHDGSDVTLGKRVKGLLLNDSIGGDKLEGSELLLILTSNKWCVERDNLSSVDVTVAELSQLEATPSAAMPLVSASSVVLLLPGTWSLMSISSSDELSMELLSMKPESLSSSSRKSLSSSLSPSSKSLSSETILLSSPPPPPHGDLGSMCRW